MIQPSGLVEGVDANGQRRFLCSLDHGNGAVIRQGEAVKAI